MWRLPDISAHHVSVALSIAPCPEAPLVLRGVCAGGDPAVQPTEAHVMREQLDRLAAAGSSIQARMAALQQLRDLVAPLDNANDLKARARNLVPSATSQATTLNGMCSWTVAAERSLSHLAAGHPEAMCRTGSPRVGI